MSDDGMKLRAEIDAAGHLAILSVAGGGMVALLGSYGDLISGEEVLRSVLPWTLLANLLALILALSNYNLRRRTSLLYEHVEQLSARVGPSGRCSAPPTLVTASRHPRRRHRATTRKAVGR